MFSGAHVVLYSSDPEADRVFLRDVLGFLSVDAGEGWLIFKLPPAEAAVHPTVDQPKQELYLMCPDLAMALADLAAKGVAISHPAREMSWGVWASIKLPSGADLSLYQPRHLTAYDLEE
jgi:hypothetical protein